MNGDEPIEDRLEGCQVLCCWCLGPMNRVDCLSDFVCEPGLIGRRVHYPNIPGLHRQLARHDDAGDDGQEAD